MHPAKAALAQPERPVDVDEPSDAVRRPGRRQQDLPERHVTDEGLRGEGARPMLSGAVAEGWDDKHAGGDGQAGELRVTLHPPRGLHRVQRERTAVRPLSRVPRVPNGATLQRTIERSSEDARRLGDVSRAEEIASFLERPAEERPG